MQLRMTCNRLQYDVLIEFQTDIKLLGIKKCGQISSSKDALTRPSPSEDMGMLLEVICQDNHESMYNQNVTENYSINKRSTTRSQFLGVKDVEVEWIGWVGVNMLDELGQRSLTKALAEKRCIPVFLDEETVRQVMAILS
ncbi:hypothetical protein L2E82_45885 [Cichorium intybus]|uniref:Uncharacterized protein n=1 Tax=Cichorium intybus TaxID=13427 RepID=A0ACB8ZUQ8_CICIN|nr:hypothetical protein L2E82_45885 [Cichorium intybus]